MKSPVKVLLQKNLENNEYEYFFTLLSERFDYLNDLWIKELEKKFNKKLKPIFVSNTQKNGFYQKENFILINERLQKLQKKLGIKRVIFQSETEDLNLEFCHSEFIDLLIRKLLRKQNRVFVLSWTSANLFFNDPRVIILGPDPHITTKYDNKIEQANLFRELKLPQNEVKIYQNFSEVKKIATKYYPFYLSATFSSGGNESRVIQSPEELEKYFVMLRTINKDNKFLVAKFIENVVLAPNSNAIVTDRNTTEILCISDQMLHGIRYIGNIYPSKVSSNNRKIIIEVTKKVGNYLSLLGFRGLFGCDFLIDDKDHCYIVDLNPRRQGGYLCNVLILQSKDFNIIEAELKLALGKKVSPLGIQDLPVDYAWAHSKVKPSRSNYEILSILKSGEPYEPFVGEASVFKTTFLPKGYLYVAGTAGYCIVSGKTREEVENEIENIIEVMTVKYFKLNKKLPEDYFDRIEILNLLK